jgi:hypothetical protein
MARKRHLLTCGPTFGKLDAVGDFFLYFSHGRDNYKANSYCAPLSGMLLIYRYLLFFLSSSY